MWIVDDRLGLILWLAVLLLAVPSKAGAANDPVIPDEQAPVATFYLSPGDQLRVTVSGVGSEQFTGDYQVNMNSALEIPYLPPIDVHDIAVADLEQRIEQKLVDGKVFRPGNFSVTVQSLEYAPVDVTVSGAVFNPGRVTINNEQTGNSATKEVLVGANAPDRHLTSALLAAGGVTPRADVSAIKVMRGADMELIVDLSGLFRGERVADVPLVSGDLIVVPDSGTFQARNVKPSPITPSEVATYVSNVTEPISSRATLESSDRVVNETLFGYGTRLTQAVIAAQCAGGTQGVNAARKVVYVHTDETTGEVTTIEQPVSLLVRESVAVMDDPLPETLQSSTGPSTARYGVNPYLMPKDGIVCYDSAVVSLRDIFVTAAAILLPVTIWQNIFDR
jgi:polysaccharide biosynthesis/export protein